MNGFLGVIIFSGSLPATRIAVGGFTPLFLTSARAVIAAVLGAALLGLLRQRRPAAGDLGPLTTAIFGVLRGGERPRPAFWLFSITGSLSVAGFALSQSGSGSLAGDLLM